MIESFHSAARRKHRKQDVCQKCGKQATIKSIVNGKVEYCLCSECYLKRNADNKTKT